MKESYGEGVATHTGPESCVEGRKVLDEALTGVRAGWVSSRVIAKLQGADAFGLAEGNTARGDSASPERTLRGPRPHARSETPRTRIGRSHGCLAAKGAGQAASGSPRT
jgi:RNA-directed DNA polymerase